MSEQLPSGDGPQPDATGSVCPWCSAALPASDLDRCPSCGAALHESAEGPVPGVTQIDVDAVISARTPVQRSRGLIGWLAGEYEPEPEQEKAEGLEPPDAEVRREMLRMELEALEAEVHSRQVEAVVEAVEAGVDIETLQAAAEAEAGAASSDGAAPEGATDADEATDEEPAKDREPA